MKLEEVLPALRAGKKIRCGAGRPIDDDSSRLSGWLSAEDFLSDNWSIVEEPATDEELAAAFEAQADRWLDAKSQPDLAVGWMMRRCADMVRKRYVDPSWKPAAKAGK